MKKIYLVALLLAILTGIAVYLYAGSLEKKAQVVEIPMTTVVVAAQTIPENVYITADMLLTKSIPTEYAAPNAVLSVNEVVGKVNIYRTYAGQQVVQGQLGSTEEAAVEAGGRLSYTLPTGKRAYTLYTTEISGVGGYVMPGDRVDVLCTINIIKSDGAGNAVNVPTAMLLVENVNVLETGTIARKLSTDEEEKNSLYTSLTLELTPEEAIEVQYAVSYGSVCVLLRPVEDTKIVAPKPYTGEGQK